MSKMNWATAEDVAMKFRPFLEQHVPHLVEEMQGRLNFIKFDYISCFRMYISLLTDGS